MNNIYVGNNGAEEESNTIRIGDSGHTSAFLAGVQLVPAASRQFKQDIHDMDRSSNKLRKCEIGPVPFSLVRPLQRDTSLSAQRREAGRGIHAGRCPTAGASPRGMSGLGALDMVPPLLMKEVRRCSD